MREENGLSRRRRMIWLLPHPLLLSPFSKLFLFLSLPACPRSTLLNERVRGGVWEEPNHTTSRKPGPLSTFHYSLSASKHTLNCIKNWSYIPCVFLYKVTLIVDRKVHQKYITYPRLSSRGGNVIVVKSNLHICKSPHVYGLVVPVRQVNSHRCHQLLCSSFSSTWISCRTNISFLSPSVDFWRLKWKYTV